MPKAMTEAEIDPIAEQVDQDMMESGEAVQVTQHKFDPLANYGDLSDGGKVGGVEVLPVGPSGKVVFDKRLREPGRPTVRMVWTWDGRASTIPLSYEPSGKRHDGGRKYLLKRHCTVCNYSGFYGPICPACRKDGRKLVPVVPAYYLKREQVPRQQRFFGAVDCFMPTCVRRGEYGFTDEAQMRQHAASRHRMEYRAFQEAQAMSSKTQLDALQAQINALIGTRLQEKPTPIKDDARKERLREYHRRRRAAQKEKEAAEGAA